MRLTRQLLWITLGLVAELALYVIAGLALTPILLILLLPHHPPARTW